MKIIKQMGAKPFTEGMKTLASIDLGLTKLEASRELFKATMDYQPHSEKRRQIATELQYINDEDWMVDNYSHLIHKYVFGKKLVKPYINYHLGV